MCLDLVKRRVLDQSSYQLSTRRTRETDYTQNPSSPISVAKLKSFNYDHDDDGIATTVISMWILLSRAMNKDLMKQLGLCHISLQMLCSKLNFSMLPPALRWDTWEVCLMCMKDIGIATSIRFYEAGVIFEFEVYSYIDEIIQRKIKKKHKRAGKSLNWNYDHDHKPIVKNYSGQLPGVQNSKL